MTRQDQINATVEQVPFGDLYISDLNWKPSLPTRKPARRCASPKNSPRGSIHGCPKAWNETTGGAPKRPALPPCHMILTSPLLVVRTQLAPRERGFFYVY